MFRCERSGYSNGKGARRFDESIDVEVLPMIDGGEGFVNAILDIKGGDLIHKEVTGPVGNKTISYFGVFDEKGERTAVIEMAAVAGLKLVPLDQRNPLKTTSYGVGELISCALDLEVDKILIGCGDSGISDGGAGMAQALGIQFLDKDRQMLTVKGGEDLLEIDYIDTSNLDKRLSHIPVDVACNWKNVLCGEKGVARVFGPQKGATSEQVEQLSSALEHYALLIQGAVGIDVRSLPGSGASGGLGAGLLAFAGATLHSRFDIIRNFINIEQAIASSDVVITAEGSLDSQTPNGKIPAEVARIALKYDVPVIIIAGAIGDGANLNYRAGIDAYSSITQRPISLKEALEKAPYWIEESTEAVLRKIAIGLQVAKREEASDERRIGRLYQKQ
ncbi:glycerate kinase family protein [Halobacillus shinanisalinarum]|uniref:glycerate kinase family protein n=1 Tax=Halobacillus shinanisalinarum TaxID=2932258 RepID=UPI002961EB44|nr:glycerate kinase [Halobacillus shinanisalinarum]